MDSPLKLDERVAELARRNPGQLNQEEYLFVAKTLSRRSPCDLLVFGVGRDSSLWIDINEGGRSTFLESDSGWIERVRSECPPIDVRLVHYGTKRRDWKTLLQADPRKLRMDLPPDIAASSWDIIFVDAPPGYRDTHPGRMQSICTAARLAHQHPPADVLVHDCNRTVERVYTDRFLGSANLLAQVHHLRQYRLRGE